MLDLALVAAEGFNRTSVFNSETNVEDEMWLTLDQLQGPQSQLERPCIGACRGRRTGGKVKRVFIIGTERDQTVPVVRFDASPRAWEQGGKWHALFF